MIEKIIRDPVHDVIAFQVDRPGERLLFDLLNTREFQRLRRIRQLGLATLAYPGADHSRYSHSLGVMQVARYILDRLGKIVTIEEDDRTACLAGALLHDLGHGPFSHVFERVSGIGHEELTRRIISDPDSEVYMVLAAFEPQMPQRVLGMIRCAGPRTFYHDILCSQLDADRFDYLLRDNLMTGSRYGGFDLRWLLQHITVDPATRRLAVTSKGISAIESYLQGRYHMYRNVYFHKVVRSAEGMVKLALQRARRLAVQERLTWPTRDQPVHKALVGQQLPLRDLIDLDDISIMHCFKVWASGEDAVLASLCRGLLDRELFKTLDLTRLSPQRAEAFRQEAAQAIDAAGGESAYDLFYDEPAETPYETFFSAESSGEGGEILIRDPSGRLFDFTSISPLSLALNEQLMFRRLHVAPAHRARLAAMLDAAS